MAIMAGDGDKVVSPRLADRLRAAIPGSTLRIVAGAGHMVHHVAADQVAEAILAVVRTSSGPVSSGEWHPKPQASTGDAAEAA